MNNFKFIGTIPTEQAYIQLIQHPKLWNQNSLRTQHAGTMHAEVEDIWLRFNNIEGDLSNILNDLECEAYPAWNVLSRSVDLVFQLIQRVRGIRLGRCMFSRLPPNGRVYRHSDQGAYPQYYERFHIVLQGGPGNLFFCGDEYVEMLTGQIWQFENLVEHEVFNNSDKDRIHLIVDLKL